MSRISVALACAAILVAAIGSTVAQPPPPYPPYPPPPPPPAPGPGYPVVSGAEFSFSIGYFEPAGNSDFWDTQSQYLTLDPSDLSGALWGAAFAWHINPYFDLQVVTQYYSASTNVVYNDFVDDNGVPFSQTHWFYEAPLDFNIKFLPIGRMSRDANGQFHHLRPVVPYLGGGIGVIWWEYDIQGWFVDNIFNPNIAYYNEISTNGFSPSVNVFGCFEVQFSPWIAIFFEGRYRWASGSLGGGYPYTADDIDLSGGSLSTGVSFRF